MKRKRILIDCLNYRKIYKYSYIHTLAPKAMADILSVNSNTHCRR